MLINSSTLFKYNQLNIIKRIRLQSELLLFSLQVWKSYISNSKYTGWFKKNIAIANGYDYLIEKYLSIRIIRNKGSSKFCLQTL